MREEEWMTETKVSKNIEKNTHKGNNTKSLDASRLSFLSLKIRGGGGRRTEEDWQERHER